MSYKCPLCGNNRLGNSLFCAGCTKKVQSDYEVELPENIVSDSKLKKDSVIEENNSNEFADNSDLDIGEPVTEIRDHTNDVYPAKKNSSGKLLLRTLIILLLLIGVYFVYNKTIREKNLERSAWETAVKENSVDGYLKYIKKHPSGIHFDDAQEGLMKLKQNEVLIWEELKKSENTSELRGFINQYSSSPYMSLVEARLDSLSWIASLKTNTAESYYEYIDISQRGELRGDYTAEAQKRYDWLYQSTPVEAYVLDSIKTTVSGFYSALSSLNHAGMYGFLAHHVHRFFDSGGASRERITGVLLMTAAQTENSRISFTPDIDGVQYSRLNNGSYEVNVPLLKSYSDGNRDVLTPGYIVHITMNSAFEINSIYETKPFSGAP